MRSRIGKLVVVLLAITTEALLKGYRWQGINALENEGVLNGAKARSLLLLEHPVLSNNGIPSFIITNPPSTIISTSCSLMYWTADEKGQFEIDWGRILTGGDLALKATKGNYRLERSTWTWSDRCLYLGSIRLQSSTCINLPISFHEMEK